jgi:hypothetical protein
MADVQATVVYYDPPQRPPTGVRPDFTRLPLSGQPVQDVDGDPGGVAVTEVELLRGGVQLGGRRGGSMPPGSSPCSCGHCARRVIPSGMLMLAQVVVFGPTTGPTARANACPGLRPPDARGHRRRRAQASTARLESASPLRSCPQLIQRPGTAPASAQRRRPCPGRLWVALADGELSWGSAAAGACWERSADGATRPRRCVWAGSR